MRDASETTWWRRTWQFAAATIGVSAVAALLCLIAGVEAGDQVFLGLPLGPLLAGAVAPLVVLAAAFTFVRRQQALDRRYDVAEE